MSASRRIPLWEWLNFSGEQNNSHIFWSQPFWDQQCSKNVRDGSFQRVEPISPPPSFRIIVNYFSPYSCSNYKVSLFWPQMGNTNSSHWQMTSYGNLFINLLHPWGHDSWRLGLEAYLVLCVLDCLQMGTQLIQFDAEQKAWRNGVLPLFMLPGLDCKYTSLCAMVATQRKRRMKAKKMTVLGFKIFLLWWRLGFFVF